MTNHPGFELPRSIPVFANRVASDSVSGGGAAMQACVALLLATLAIPRDARAEDVMRQDFSTRTIDGYGIAVREVRAPAEPNDVPVIVVHGARVPGIGSFDLQVPGGSLAEDLAKAGHRVYVMDARGYGRSTRPPEMDAPALANPPLVRAWAVMRDLAAVSREVRQRTGAGQVALLGWATGAMWSGMYAALNPDEVSHLVYYNGLYGGSDQHQMLGRGTPNENPDAPGRFNMARAEAWRLSDAADLLRSWDSVIPVKDKSTWRDPAVAEQYVKQALASDPTTASRNPPTFRAPSGAMEDSFYLATGRQLFDASTIAARVLVLRSERDFWSRPEDARTLALHLSRAQSVTEATIPDATHHVHLDRAEKGRDQFLRHVVEFLATDRSGKLKSADGRL